MYELLEAARSCRVLKGLSYSAIVYSLLTDIAQYASSAPNGGTSGQNARLRTLFCYIDENFAKSLSLGELASVAGVTPEYLCSFFRKNSNVRLFQYINSVRIQKSKELLIRFPSMTVKEVAALCGFEDANYFCAVFKRLVQLSPGSYRRMNIN